MKNHPAKKGKSRVLRLGLILGLLTVLLGFPAASGASSEQPDLEVAARFPEGSTGTMHFAEALTLKIGDAKPLVFESDFLPIPGPHFRLGPSRFILLGWSSSGAGMQSIHVLSLGVQNGAVTLIGALELSTDRLNSGLWVHFKSSPAIKLGLPEPPLNFVHSEDEWFLRYGKEDQDLLDLQGLRSLVFEHVTPGPEDFFYSPPFNRSPFPSRVAWIPVASSGLFILPSFRPRARVH
jgi:hypothetical protein